jgi:hypothetical protein
MLNPTAFALLLPVSLAIFGLFGKFSLDMRRDQDYQASWGWAFWAVLPSLLAAFYLTSDAAMSIPARNIVLGLLGGIVGVCAAIWLGYLFQSQSAGAQTPSPAAPPVVNQGSGSAYSSGQQGGITAGTVYIVPPATPPRMVFSNAIGSELLSKMPIMQSIGNNLDQEVATKIQQFLSENGYEVERTGIGVMAPPPEHKISIAERSDSYVLIVAPSAL